MVLGYLSPYRRGSVSGNPRGSTLFDLHRQMNRMFDDLFDADGDSGFYARAGMSAPAMDIHNGDDAVEICAELPGVREEDVDLSIEEGVLTLRGEKKSTREDKEAGYSERSYGTFERRITLPSNIDTEACSAHFEDGVLTITLPKSEERNRGRKIPLGKPKSASKRPEDMLIKDKSESKAAQETQETPEHS